MKHTYFPSSLRKIALTLAGIALLGLSSCKQASTPVTIPTPPPGLEQPLSGYLNGLYALANSEPRDYQQLTMLGRAYEAHELWDQAAQTYRAAIALDPGPAPPWFHLALVERERGNDQDAIDLHEQVADQSPNFVANLDRVGNERLQRGQLKEAEAAFATIIKLAPSMPQGHIGLAQVRLAEKNFSEAARLSQTAMQHSGQNRLALYTLGLAMRGIGSTEQARVLLIRGAGAQTDFITDSWQDESWRLVHSPQAAVAAARIAIAQSQPQRAIELAEKAIQWQRQTIDAYNIIAVAQLMLGKPSEACDALAPALSFAPDHLETHLNLASCFGALGKLETAMQHAERAIALAPMSARGYHLKAKVLMGSSGTSNLAQAIANLEKTLELDPGESVAERELGFLQLNAGNLNAAQQVFERITQNEPGAPWGQLGLAEVALRNRDTESVRQHLAQARAIDPSHPGLASLQARLQALEPR